MNESIRCNGCRRWAGKTIEDWAAIDGVVFCPTCRRFLVNCDRVKLSLFIADAFILAALAWFFVRIGWRWLNGVSSGDDLVVPVLLLIVDCLIPTAIGFISGLMKKVEEPKDEDPQ